MQRVWFTADTHFGHANVIGYSRRPFGSVDEMDAMLIENWNRLVGERDHVWHLGDVAVRADPLQYLRRLNGRIHWIAGNHDSAKAMRRAVDAGVVVWAGDVRYLRARGERLYLSHYAHRVWRNSHHGSLHLYGHSHGDLLGHYRSMDVGVDAVARGRQGGVGAPHHYHPIELAEVVEALAGYRPAAHHTPRPRPERAL